LLITKIESCRVGRVQIRIRKIGGSNPSLGTKERVKTERCIQKRG